MNDQTKKALKEQYKNRPRKGGLYCVKCIQNDKHWVHSSTDLKGAKNRFDFSILTNTCLENEVKEDWNIYGPSSFSFEILEEITKKETQSEREFADDVATLFEIWNEKENAQ